MIPFKTYINLNALGFLDYVFGRKCWVVRVLVSLIELIVVTEVTMYGPWYWPCKAITLHCLLATREREDNTQIRRNSIQHILTLLGKPTQWLSSIPPTINLKHFIFTGLEGIRVRATVRQTSSMQMPSANTTLTSSDKILAGDTILNTEVSHVLTWWYYIITPRSLITCCDA